jgi:hypothetical protein
MNRLTPRGRKVRAILIALLLLAAIYALSAYVWWTEDGICLGTLSGCVGI